MTEELEALVGHVYIVGGRSVRAAPPGAHVELAPKRCPTGRENDAFFTLVLPTQGPRAQATFYEQMARHASQKYFSNGGSTTNALRDVLVMLNDNLAAHNKQHPDRPFYADIVCMVLRHQEVIVGKTGGGLVLLWQDDDLRTFPQDLQDPDLLNGIPLGYRDAPDLKMARFEVKPGDVIALTDASWNHVSLEGLAAVQTSDGVQNVVAQLKRHPLQETSVMVVQLISPDDPDPPPPPEPPPAKKTGSAPPVTQPPGKPANAAPAASQPAASQPAPSQSPAKPASAPASTAAKSSARRGLLPFRRQKDDFKPPRQSRRQAQREARSTLEQVQTGSKNLLVRLRARVLKAAHWIVTRLLALVSGLRRLLDRSIPEPEAGQRPSLPTPVAASIAILIPVAVVILVVWFTLTGRDDTVFETCLNQFEEQVAYARIADENNLDDANEYWSRAMDAGRRCREYRPEDPLLVSMLEETQSRLDDFDLVTRCPTTPLRQYERGADLRGPILQGDVDLYLLDRVRSTIYRETLSDRGNILIGEGETIVQGGQALGDVVVRDLVDITWVTEGGLGARSALVALDALSGAIVSYSPTFPPARAQPLVGADLWLRPVAIAAWSGRLYVLDPAANQIWRYVPEAGSYPSAPEEYFTGLNRPDLSSAVDIAIDDGGNVYILSADGQIAKYYAGEQLLFQFAQMPSHLGGALGSANAMHLDLGLLRPGFWVLDAENQVVYELTTAGTFLDSFRAPSGTSFRGLSGLTVDDSTENIYILAWNTLYHMQRCE